jgi:acetyl-CoA carboxylase carboxyl transferase subunit alpha
MHAKQLKTNLLLANRNPLRLAAVPPYIDLMPDHMRSYLDFEKPVAELEAKVDELRALAATGSDIGDEIRESRTRRRRR